MNISTPIPTSLAKPYKIKRNDETIAIIGLGYVGLPVAIAFANKFENVVGFDINQDRIHKLENGIDNTGEITKDSLENSSIDFTTDADDLNGTTCFIVTVPTPVNRSNRPDLSPLKAACETLAPYLKKNSIVVFESTVYPGVTEDICGPILEKISGLVCGVDFKLAYSPERINPGDQEHQLENIAKVVSGQNTETLVRVANIYGSIIDAEIHSAPSIRVAETAKVIENTQRDVNIALMNEISLICDRINISSKDVIAAASTKWNFLPFTPGLVGGHCIGVDPYYLTAKAEELGYHSQVILSGRRVNDSMGEFVAQKAIKMLSAMHTSLTKARVGVFGLTFKEDVPDLRNSKTFDILETLSSYGINPLIHDALAAPDDVAKEVDCAWYSANNMPPLDIVILAVPHKEYLQDGGEALVNLLQPSGGIIDVRGAIDNNLLPDNMPYWCL